MPHQIRSSTWLPSLVLLLGCSSQTTTHTSMASMGNVSSGSTTTGGTLPATGGVTNTGAVGTTGAGVTSAVATTAGAGGTASGVTGSTTTTGASTTGGMPPEPEAMPPSLVGDVSFSVPSGTFEGQLQVGMTASVQPSEIRYTTDGSLPTDSSTLYDGTPVTLSETAQVRAQLFVNGFATGLPSTSIYIRRTFDYNSDIPIVIMEGYGLGQPEDKENWIDLAFMTFEPGATEAALSAPPSLATRAGYRRRGQSSMNFEKVPYRFELWDNNDQDADYVLLGMEAESDWAMIGPCSDRSLVRNAFIYSLSRDMGLSAMQLRFAEVFINYDGGPLEQSDYEGVYAVTQTIKNQKSRLDLAQLEPEDTMLPDITGGYIFKFDQAAIDEGETEIVCAGLEDSSSTTGFGQQDLGGCWDDLELVDPDPANAEQVAYITEHLQAFHDVLHTEPVGDYMSMMNVQSFVDHFIINEITRDVDAYIRSHYMHKDRDGLITAGPVWDYNFALGNVSTDLEGWQWEEGRTGSNDWYDIIAADPVFFAQVQARWQELRPSVLSDAQVNQRIDMVAAPLVNAGPRDIERWPVGECGSFGGGFGGIGGGNTGGSMSGTTWESQIQELKDWTRDRLLWLDSQLL